MIQQKKINVERILRVNRVGAWRIEIEDGKSPRFYADAVMDELLGIQGEISPEERFLILSLTVYLNIPEITAYHPDVHVPDEM